MTNPDKSELPIIIGDFAADIYELGITFSTTSQLNKIQRRKKLFLAQIDSLIAESERMARLDELTRAETAFTNNEFKERIVTVYHQYMDERIAELSKSEEEK